MAEIATLYQAMEMFIQQNQTILQSLAKTLVAEATEEAVSGTTLTGTRT